LNSANYVCALGPCGGVRPGGKTWVMVPMKRAAVAMAAFASTVALFWTPNRGW